MVCSPAASSGGYVNSVTNLHGWADGDPIMVNYVGHPMQGSVSGDIWIQNDPKYRTAEFGRNRRYWVSRLRAATFAWAYSEQFEIGPISEASIGHVQNYFPQQGFVDHVITPAVGFGWMVAEDFLDRYVVKRIEAWTTNRCALRPLRVIRMVARGGLNPSRSFANAMAFREPWHRDTLLNSRESRNLAPRGGGGSVIWGKPDAPSSYRCDLTFVA